MRGLKTGAAAISAPLLFCVLTAGAVDVREKAVFTGSFDMHTSRGVTFAFECDDADAVQRRYVYFKSGNGYYMVPFSVKASGRSIVTVDRIACSREEGKVSGWRNVSEIMVSFWRDDAKPVKWRVSDLALRTDPYLAVVSVAGQCAHDYPAKLEDCGLSALLVSADELDDRVLAPARLLVPIWGKKKYSAEAMDAMRRFEARGGRVVALDFIPGFSTTNIINKLKN